MPESDRPESAGGTSAFQSIEAQRFWPYIERPVDRIVAALASLDAAGVDVDWRPGADDANSVYVLATHALGNPEEQMLGVLGVAAITRDRDAEFAAVGGSASTIQRRWSILRVEIQKALQALSDVDLETSRRHPRRGLVSGHDVLILVARHMAEHAGQAELTRDLAIAAHRAA